MLPVIALVGRPNVGKSTLFNRLTRSRDAIVADMPGLTRDRHYGHGRLGSRPYLVIDTGGFEPVAKEGMLAEMAKQTRLAIDEADVVIFMTDARLGLHPRDQDIAQLLRKTGRPVILAVNKAEGLSSAAVAEFYKLGLGEPEPLSGAHGDGVHTIIEAALAKTPEPETELEADTHGIGKIAIVGRPNAGKSTLINALLGHERVIAFDEPGTTRDAIEINFSYQDKPYKLIDTAGLRRRGKVFEAVEKFSVVKTLQAIESANVVVLVLDCKEFATDQDAHIADFIVQSGRSLVVALNKWDAVESDDKDRIKAEAARKLRFLDFAKFLTISAKHSKGLAGLMTAVKEAHASAFAKLSTNRLNNALIAAVAKQGPPRKGYSRPKPRYCHQGGQNPPVIVVHGNAVEAMPQTYTRYLEGQFRTVFKLDGTPLRIQYRDSHNPYDDKDDKK